MTGEPTLHYGDRSADGWVEYLQELLSEVAPNLGIDGIFGDQTIRAVYAFQEKRGLMVDGVVGNQTWAALRGEEPAAVGTDGHQHQDTDHRMHAVWFDDGAQSGPNGEYDPPSDEMTFYLSCVGDTPVPNRTYMINVGFNKEGLYHFDFGYLEDSNAADETKPGGIMIARITDVKQGCDAGVWSYTAEIPDELGGGKHEGTFTIE